MNIPAISMESIAFICSHEYSRQHHAYAHASFSPSRRDRRFAPFSPQNEWWLDYRRSPSPRKRRVGAAIGSASQNRVAEGLAVRSSRKTASLLRHRKYTQHPITACCQRQDFGWRWRSAVEAAPSIGTPLMARQRMPYIPTITFFVPLANRIFANWQGRSPICLQRSH